MTNSLKERKEQRLIKMWEEYSHTKSAKVRDQLIIEYSQVVKYIALRVSAGLPDEVEVEDLISVGIIGLIKAVENFNPAVGVKFETFAGFRIKGAMLDELRQRDWIPRSARQKIKEISSAYQQLESELGRTPYDKEVADFLGMTEEEFNIANSETAPVVFSLENEIFSSEGDGISFEETIKDERAEDPLVAMEKTELKSVIKESINELKDKEKLIVALYHFEELNLKEIGKVLNISEGRVSQIHSKALAKLKAKVQVKIKGLYQSQEI